MKNICVFFLSVLLFTSCSINRIVYDVSLLKVEAPANVTKQYYDSVKVKKHFYYYEDRIVTEYKYEDNNIAVSSNLDFSDFSMSIKNKTDSIISIPWDDAAYINIYGESQKVTNKGFVYLKEGNSVSNIPKDSVLNCEIFPINFYRDTRGQWWMKPVFDFHIDKRHIKKQKGAYIGKTVKVVLPIIIQNIKYEYAFEYKINDIYFKREPFIFR